MDASFMCEGDDPAFPCATSTDDHVHIENGMSYRKWLIGQFGSGLVANSGIANIHTNVDRVADLSIRSADAVLAKLNKELL
jgi:hypothetical protein